MTLKVTTTLASTFATTLATTRLAPTTLRTAVRGRVAASRRRAKARSPARPNPAGRAPRAATEPRQSDPTAEVAGMALEGEGNQEEFAEPRTPNRTEQGEGMVVDEELLS